MDCVGCQKCRLWGKIQITGLGTALKVLFAYDENNLRFVIKKFFFILFCFFLLIYCFVFNS